MVLPSKLAYRPDVDSGRLVHHSVDAAFVVNPGMEVTASSASWYTVKQTR